MKIERFEEIEAWVLARALACKVYALTKKTHFSHDFGLKQQIQNAAGSAMHNIAEGFDAESNTEFIRFLRYAKRSCTEVQSELYVSVDQEYITKEEFQDAYNHAGRTRAAIRGFIKYLMGCKKDGPEGESSTKVQGLKNSEPLNPEPNIYISVATTIT